MNPVRSVAAVFLGLVACLSVARSEDVKPIRVLMVTGGCCHDYANQKTILSEGISARANVEWTIAYYTDKGTGAMDKKTGVAFRPDCFAKPDWAAGYDVVLHNECWASITEPEYVEKVAAAHRNGVGAVVLHCAMHTFRDAQVDTWRECLGITSKSHEKQQALEIKNLAPENAIMKTVPATWTLPPDEPYVALKVWPSTIPLGEFTAEQTKTKSVCIWQNTYGKGRIFGTTLSHHNKTMQDPVFLDMVTRGLLWSCDKLDDKGNPKPGYEAKKK